MSIELTVFYDHACPFSRITDLPGLRWVFDSFYLWFARNRLAMSAWLGYTKTCNAASADGVCQVK